jgi:hypothetical protein
MRLFGDCAGMPWPETWVTSDAIDPFDRDQITLD